MSGGLLGAEAKEAGGGDVSKEHEAEVKRLTRRLMRAFDGKHHRFLIDYGWEQVARVVLRRRTLQVRP